MWLVANGGNCISIKGTHTFVNGHLVYENGTFYEEIKGQALVKYQ
jgi:dihydroorotase